ncbi:hypothetical protein OG474_23325 [Kribbella sp. NBC_01505]|uniref:hypothetical protein n=1 Tax=Kribbella sp. NBC_01505 TaxID=2903580 RepID=UPI00386FF06A
MDVRDDYCGHCYAEADAVALSGPLGRIPADLIAPVAAEVPDHWGDFTGLYRKLTPRIMALLVYDELHVDEELIAARIAEAGCWETWPDVERDAMLDVCRAWWAETLGTHPRRPQAHEVLSFLATAPVPLTHWFEVWNAQPPGPADLHALELCQWWAPELIGTNLTLGWSSTIDVTTDVKRWILEDAKPRLARVPDDARLNEVLAYLESDDSYS